MLPRNRSVALLAAAWACAAPACTRADPSAPATLQPDPAAEPQAATRFVPAALTPEPELLLAQATPAQTPAPLSQDPPVDLDGPDETPTPEPTGTPTPEPTATAEPRRREELADTGYDTALVGLAGLALLGGGIGLRLRYPRA